MPKKNEKNKHYHKKETLATPITTMKERVVASLLVVVLFMIPILCCCGAPVTNTYDKNDPSNNVVNAAVVGYSWTSEDCYGIISQLYYNAAYNRSWEVDLRPYNIPYTDGNAFATECMKMTPFVSYNSIVPASLRISGYKNSDGVWYLDSMWFSACQGGSPLAYREMQYAPKFTGTDIQKVNAIMNYIKQKAPTYGSGYSAYDCMRGDACCEGYTMLFQYLCDKSGLQCLSIGCYSRNHAWNKVKVGNNWYNVDACWNRSRTDNKYFLKSDTVWKETSHGVPSEWNILYGAGKLSLTQTEIPGCYYNYY